MPFEPKQTEIIDNFQGMTKPSKSAIRRLAAAVLLINLFIITLAVLWLDHSKLQDQDDAAVATRNISQLLERHLVGTVEKIDLALIATADEIQHQVISGKIDNQTLNAFMARQQDRLPEISSLRATNAKGVVSYGTEVNADALQDNSDRDYFTRQRDNPEAGLVFSKPVLARIDKKWVVALSRPIQLPNGAFGGVVYANLPLEHLAIIFSTIDIGKHGLIALYDIDFGLIARHPELSGIGSAIGQKAGSRKFRELVSAGQTSATYTAQSVTDGIERVFSYRKAASLPYYMVVGLATDEILAEWREEAIRVSILLTLFCLSTLWLAWLFYRGWKLQIVTHELLAEQEEKFRIVADYTYDWEYWQGPDKGIIYMSPSCEQITGYAQAEFVATPSLLERIVYPDDQHLIQKHVIDFVSHDDEALDFRIVTRDGEIRWIAHGCRPVYGANGQFMGRRANNRDITGRKQVEVTLSESESRFYELFESMSNGVAVYRASSDGRNFIFTDLNRAAERIEKVRREDLIGKSVEEVFPSVREFGLLDVFQRVWHSGVAEHFPVSFYQDERLSGWRENFVYKLPSGEIVAIFEDITERKKLEEELDRQAHTDYLTGLANRRHFLEQAELELARAVRYGKQLSVLMVDIDHFKKVNDVYGHKTGDMALQKLSEVALKLMREVDIVGRLGGEEFAVLLPETNGEMALEVAERFRSSIANTDVLLESGASLRFTISIGVASLGKERDSFDTLLNQADQALYEAKNAGRDRVCGRRN